MSGPILPLVPAPLPLACLDAESRQPVRATRALICHRVDRLPPRAPRFDIIEDLAAAGEIVALVGAPGSGKSALAALLARAIADGAAFLGRPVLAGAVIYVAAERAAEVERRLRAAASPGAAIYVCVGQPQLSDAASVDELVEAIKATANVEPLPIRLIVLDTAARCFRGLDENSSRDMGLAAEGMARIVEACPTAVLVIVHHLGKNGSTMRGSGALLGAVDLELTVRGGGDNRRLDVTKANTVAEGQRLVFRLVPVQAADGLVISAVAPDTHCPGEPNTVTAGNRLPPDAAAALDALVALTALGQQVSPDQWRDATMQAFGERNPPAKRKAWSKAQRLLTEAGRILVHGNCVSVSDA